VGGSIDIQPLHRCILQAPKHIRLGAVLTRFLFVGLLTLAAMNGCADDPVAPSGPEGVSPDASLDSSIDTPLADTSLADSSL
jgi:hypothetical protein